MDKRQYLLAILDLAGFATMLEQSEDPVQKSSAKEMLGMLEDIKTIVVENIL